MRRAALAFPCVTSPSEAAAAAARDPSPPADAMESSLLDALECAICLNQLSDSNRVLPCQHTFCLQCLLDVVASRGELHCPECRTPVLTPVAELPQNIVLVRLLETLRTARAAPTPAHRPVLERGVSCDGFAEGSPFVRRASQTNPFLPAGGGAGPPSGPPPPPPPPAAPPEGGGVSAEEKVASLLAEFDPLQRRTSPPAAAPAPAPGPGPAAAPTPSRPPQAIPCARALFSYAGTQEG